MARTFIVAALLFISAFTLPARSDAQQLPADLDAYVTRAMSAFEVPGVSLAIVKDGKVVVAKGYGVRRLGEPAAVDARTLFGIASNTKAFTATALGILVDEGKIRWDAPVIDYVPWFQLSDPYVTREMTVRDLLARPPLTGSPRIRQSKNGGRLQRRNQRTPRRRRATRRRSPRSRWRSTQGSIVTRGTAR